MRRERQPRRRHCGETLPKWLPVRALPKRESCILGKIFIDDIDADGTLTAKWCFGVGKFDWWRVRATTKKGDFR